MRYVSAFMVLSLVMAFSVPSAQSKGGPETDGLEISSPAFENNGYMPAKYTCDGDDSNPPLSFGNIPRHARSLVLIVDDPDAPNGIWVHWVLWNIAPPAQELKANAVPKGAVQGLNDFKQNKYRGPCPPSGTHRYFFKLYALDTTLDLPPNAKKADVERAMSGHIISRSRIIGLYKRK